MRKKSIELHLHLLLPYQQRHCYQAKTTPHTHFTHRQFLGTNTPGKRSPSRFYRRPSRRDDMSSRSHSRDRYSRRSHHRGMDSSRSRSMSRDRSQLRKRYDRSSDRKRHGRRCAQLPATFENRQDMTRLAMNHKTANKRCARI